MSPHRIGPVKAPQDVQKRVCKACNRCRLKKSKCNGLSPCTRCKVVNSICVFGDTKKLQDKVYPKGYVEMLEQQQAQLVAGLHVLHSRLQNGQGWPGQKLQEGRCRYPSVHDILERLDLLRSSSRNSGFEEDFKTMQLKLLNRGILYNYRQGSKGPDLGYEHATSRLICGAPPMLSVSHNDTFALEHFPTIAPSDRRPRQSRVALPIEHGVTTALSPVVETGSAFDSTAQAMKSIITDEALNLNESMYAPDISDHFDSDTMTLDPSIVGDTEPIICYRDDWNDLDFNNFLEFSADPLII
ncbi:hypothetical protein B0J11DRAFT_239654 [Dendryphion nanum]|uniref:Zn(2)-C6 fungal-type domain-containing protein n=1 Tax=Dendryphion nanum TaxID=256645 RepID=A0A9P9I6G7_9PLEO|nr:hypothetical protein B0J11DRAFT_239654 [Dendryphion nanum]